MYSCQWFFSNLGRDLKRAMKTSETSTGRKKRGEERKRVGPMEGNKSHIGFHDNIFLTTFTTFLCLSSYLFQLG